MLLYGAGGHAKVVISCVLANNDKIQAIFDDDLSKQTISGIEIKGSYNASLFPDNQVVIAIGNNQVRRAVARKIRHKFATIVHPTAIVDETVRIGPGSVVMHKTVIQSDATIGRHVIINTGSTVDHDCCVADFVHIAPGVVLCGNVQVGESTLVGAGSILTPNVKIGSDCLIAAGSVVTMDIPDGSIVRGNPARIIKTTPLKSEILPKIWLSPPHAGGHEMKYIKEAFDTNWLAPVGPNINAFEQELGTFVNCNHVAALASGTASLHLALIALNVSRDDIVLCQSLTFIASANPIKYQNATPVFIDSEPDTWNICPNTLEDALKYYTNKGKKPKAVIGVHLYGMPCKMDEILLLCQKYEVPFIEDAAEALGSRYKGRNAGNLGDMGIFSFNGNKIITTTGGGALLSNNELFVLKAKFLSAQARDEAAHYEHSQIGYNYRMSNVCAGIGRGQLEVIEERVNKRRENFKFYETQLKNLPGISFQTEPAGSISNRWLTAMLIDSDLSDGINTEKIRLKLSEQNIESRPVWKPMHLQPIFKDAKYFGGTISEKIFKNGLCLPSGSDLSENDLKRITSIIKQTVLPCQ